MWENSKEMIELCDILSKNYYCSLGTEIHRNELGRPTTEYIWIYGLIKPQVSIKLYRNNDYVFAKNDNNEELYFNISETENIINRLSEIAIRETNASKD